MKPSHCLGRLSHMLALILRIMELEGWKDSKRVQISVKKAVAPGSVVLVAFVGFWSCLLIFLFQWFASSVLFANSLYLFMLSNESSVAELHCLYLYKTVTILLLMWRWKRLETCRDSSMGQRAPRITGTKPLPCVLLNLLSPSQLQIVPDPKLLGCPTLQSKCHSGQV